MIVYIKIQKLHINKYIRCIDLCTICRICFQPIDGRSLWCYILITAKQQKQWQGGIIIPSFLKRAAGAGRAVKAVWWSSPRAADPTEIFFLSRLWRSSRRYNGKQNRKQFPFCTESAFKANSGGTAFNTRPDTFSGRVFYWKKPAFQ